MKKINGISILIASLVLITYQNMGADEILGHNGIHYKLAEGWGKENFKKVYIKHSQGMVTDSKGMLILLTDDPLSLHEN